jgi:hypothetical protein
MTLFIIFLTFISIPNTKEAISLSNTKEARTILDDLKSRFGSLDTT